MDMMPHHTPAQTAQHFALLADIAKAYAIYDISDHGHITDSGKWYANSLAAYVTWENSIGSGCPPHHMWAHDGLGYWEAHKMDDVELAVFGLSPERPWLIVRECDSGMMEESWCSETEFPAECARLDELCRDEDEDQD